MMMSMMSEMSETTRLRLINATIKYHERVIIHDFSLSVKSGEMVFITGSNGAGKSTLLKAIAGLLPLSSGTLERPERLCFVPQIEEADRDFPARVREIVITGTQRQGRLFYSREDKERAAKVMKELEISELSDRELTTLSGGQLRRVFIARALCGRPELLLLDEPCAGLDAHSHEILFAALRKLLTDGCSILMVSHDESDIAGIANSSSSSSYSSRVVNLS